MSPLLDLCWRNRLHQIGGRVFDILLYNGQYEARIPCGMQVGRALASGIDLVATPVILEGDMKRLMNVAYPVPQILEGEKLLLLARRGRRQDIEVLLNCGDDAFSRARTRTQDNLVTCFPVWWCPEFFALWSVAFSG